MMVVFYCLHRPPNDSSNDKEGSNSSADPSLPSDVASIFPDLTSKVQQWNESRTNATKQDSSSSSSSVKPSSSRDTPQSSSTSSSSQQPPPPLLQAAASSPASTSNDNVILTQPCDVTMKQNAEMAQKVLDEYMKNNALVQPQSKAPSYQFPPGLFQSEVDLEGSAQAYHYHIEGLDSQDLQQILNQVDADPFKSSNVFGDLDFDFFD